MNDFTLPLVFLILLGGLPSIFAQVCGDQTCSGGESPITCPEDCGLCGNLVCDYDQGEDRNYCEADCDFYYETFTYGNDYFTWTPSSAPGGVEGDDDRYLQVTFPQRSGTTLNGYFVIQSSLNSNYAKLVTSEFRGGTLFYEIRINQAAISQTDFPDVIIYSAANNAYLYYYFDDASLSTLSNGQWNVAGIELDPASWGYIVSTSSSVSWASGSISTNADWDSFVGKVTSIWIKGQFTNNANAVTALDSLVLVPFGSYGLCGTCSSGFVCAFDTCVPEGGCLPSCAGKNCGSDGCGGSCGTCPNGQTCSTAGTCQSVCVPNCSGRNCGSDGCSGSCGTCPSGQTCNTGGVCQSVCVPNCSGRNCGSDGCSGSCGTCTGTNACVNGVCTCQPNCSGRQCGSNGCGGSCGTCTAGKSCNSGGLCVTVCGDAICDTTSETATNCPQDCQVCGDGICNGNENRATCPVDCSFICGNGACEAGETPSNCGVDCPGCGDGICQPSRGESVFNCQEDCGTCGDNVCDFQTENSLLCPEDCGYCGNGICDTDKGENQVSCEVDCGSSVCGDGRCTAGESAQTCPADCVSPNPDPSSVQITLNFAGLIPALDCCTCCGRK